MVVGFPVTQHKLVIRVCILCMPVLSLNGPYMHSMYTEGIMLISATIPSSSTIVVSAVLPRCQCVQPCGTCTAYMHVIHSIGHQPIKVSTFHLCRPGMHYLGAYKQGSNHHSPLGYTQIASSKPNNLTYMSLYSYSQIQNTRTAQVRILPVYSNNSQQSCLVMTAGAV